MQNDFEYKHSAKFCKALQEVEIAVLVIFKAHIIFMCANF